MLNIILLLVLSRNKITSFLKFCVKIFQFYPLENWKRKTFLDDKFDEFPFTSSGICNFFLCLCYISRNASTSVK